MVKPEDALKGRDESLMESCSDTHTALKSKTKPPFPAGTETIVFGMGCFWGAERRFWKLPNVYSTQVGYAGGYTKNPLYKEVCSGQTGHTEVVRVVFDPKKISLNRLLEEFFNEHDPTQVNRQGNDVGTQYRSAIYWTTAEQEKLVKQAAEAFAKQLPKDMKVASELAELKEFYYAEDYHQQYLQKNPNGYCGLRGTGYKLPDISTLNVSDDKDKQACNKDKDEQKDDL
eukprot:CAMPEP_0197020400 /NCGR_PEP_ID=MMETSP1384-20130603/1163_1 /TAXON_ID=29189 /ORGANISM="Ammonia sp." /LENGTH=228 /DNA_ID=CAMNT_0042448011 /DNA_START=129 /DNA_END=815 /DNA_ORIENTATION=-